MSHLLGGWQPWNFNHFCDPGPGAPVHVHAVEEVLELIRYRFAIVRPICREMPSQPTLDDDRDAVRPLGQRNPEFAICK